MSMTQFDRHREDGRKTGAYQSWYAMKSRCLNVNDDAYPQYGGAGIKVCDRWLSFDNFLSDMGHREDDQSIDRYPNASGNYEPGNCRWASREDQQSNIKSNLLYRGKTCAQHCRELGLNQAAVAKRLKRGWSWEQALSVSLSRNNPRLVDRTI